jgi:hypothetical protein
VSTNGMQVGWYASWLVCKLVGMQVGWCASWLVCRKIGSISLNFFAPRVQKGMFVIKLHIRPSKQLGIHRRTYLVHTNHPT